MSSRMSIPVVLVMIGSVLILAMSFGCSAFINPAGAGSHYVVDLALDPKNPRVITVSPEELEGPSFGDVIVFNNKTGIMVKVSFKSGTPFVTDEFFVPTSGSPSAQDTTIVVNPQDDTGYVYSVTAGPAETEQSPVIRVGPRPHSDES